ncbi:MAG: helix-turn-helix domain-containing protein, partial [Acidobacteriota bacterium]
MTNLNAEGTSSADPAAAPDRGRLSSLEKALDVCEALAAAPRGLSVTDLARALRQPPPTVHR